MNYNQNYPAKNVTPSAPPGSPNSKDYNSSNNQPMTNCNPPPVQTNMHNNPQMFGTNSQTPNEQTLQTYPPGYTSDKNMYQGQSQSYQNLYTYPNQVPNVQSGPINQYSNLPNPYGYQNPQMNNIPLQNNTQSKMPTVQPNTGQMVYPNTQTTINPQYPYIQNNPNCNVQPVPPPPQQVYQQQYSNQPGYYNPNLQPQNQYYSQPQMNNPYCQQVNPTIPMSINRQGFITNPTYTSYNKHGMDKKEWKKLKKQLKKEGKYFKNLYH